MSETLSSNISFKGTKNLGSFTTLMAQQASVTNLDDSTQPPVSGTLSGTANASIVVTNLITLLSGTSYLQLPVGTYNVGSITITNTSASTAVTGGVVALVGVDTVHPTAAVASAGGYPRNLLGSNTVAIGGLAAGASITQVSNANFSVNAPNSFVCIQSTVGTLNANTAPLRVSLNSVSRIA